eukprot:Blabericola_migrator_1__1853@NODE_1502_length_4400_cov_10_457881_g985_i0_p1_GENE_NODE_1502_length_4400_cov_10_457881_g985_i0NODE_1502_length_4400_cov_10_457881_g985_i0_p1_ORF_typecomplete_len275_score45_00DUF4386/PF14329_6/0_078DUF4259/PF14078_6/0_11DUF659/PF04937_15/0_12_NODE_1502_length_4400_cov_10_457881_g985_i066890
MTCLRSVVSRQPREWGFDDELGALSVMISGLISVTPNTVLNTSDTHDDMSNSVVSEPYSTADTQDCTDSVKAFENFSEEFDSVAQRLGPDHFQAAVAAAAEEIKALPEGVTVPDRLEILVKHLKSDFGEAGLTPDLERALERALETTLPKESRLAILSEWAHNRLNQILRCGREVVSGTQHLLPLASLLGMAGALPVVSESDGLIDEVVDGAVFEETVDFTSQLATAVRNWFLTYGLMAASVLFSLDALMLCVALRKRRRLPRARPNKSSIRIV